jgi:hypothetical protein
VGDSINAFPQGAGAQPRAAAFVAPAELGAGSATLCAITRFPDRSDGEGRMIQQQFERGRDGGVS